MTTPTQPVDSFLTPREAARLARVDLSTIRRWYRSGDLPAVRIGNFPRGRVRIPVSGLLARMEPVREERR